MISGVAGEGFRERALVEAARYGSDPWVFVRELAQNARDAGATGVLLTAEERDGVARLTCRDDGEGMTFDHARRFLFALYASSKERGRDDAGRFGVGFWSVLRFAPARLTVRSWPRAGRAWEVELDGALSRAQRRDPPARRGTGTEVVLERDACTGDLPRQVWDAAWRSARFLTRRDGGERPLPVRVNGRLASAHFELPAPSALFRRGRLRGAVGLGREARVELLAKGLHVRAARSLEDLLASDADLAAGAAFPDVVDGLQPQALLDGHDLELLLARSDARENDSLRRLVRLARTELARLVERQIAFVRPEVWWRRGLRAAFGGAAARAWAASAVALALGIGAGAWWSRRGAALPPPEPATVAQAPPPAAVAPRLYRDLAAFYRGPAIDTLEPAAPPVALTYEPAAAAPTFAALVIEDVDAGTARTADLPLARYAGAACESGCVDVALAVADGPGPMRLPVPTGHRIDTATVRLGGDSVAVYASSADEPLLRLERPTRSVVRYRTGPAPPPTPAQPFAPALAADLREMAARLRGRPVGERVSRLTGWVARRVRYSASPDDAARFRAAAASGRGLVSVALEVAAGDCDVQNGVLVPLLQAAGVPARLAVGYVGVDGGVAPWLHAWVEYREGDGPWRLADASRGALVPATSPALRVAAGAGPERPLAARPPMAAAPEVAEGPPPVRVLALAAAGLTLAAAGIARVRRRTRRVLRLDPDHDLTRLLLGALQNPGAFADVPALFERRLLPLATGGALSLGEAWTLASGGRLYGTRRLSELARRAARAGARVLDSSRDEGRAVADALGAIDLDAWEDLVGRSRTTPLLAAVARRLKRDGEDWDVRAARGVGGPMLLDSSVCRVLILDADETWLVDASARWATRPAEAEFTLSDRIAEHLGLPEARRARLLAPLAEAAVLEAAR